MHRSRSISGRVFAGRARLRLLLVAVAGTVALGIVLQTSLAATSTRRHRPRAHAAGVTTRHKRRHRQNHHQRHRYARAAAAITTFQAEGITMTPVAGGSSAAAGGMSAPAAVSSFEQQPVAIGMVGGRAAMAAASPTAALEMVTETIPTYPGQKPGTDESWVVTVDNAAPDAGEGVLGGPRPTSTVVCQDVGIYDISLSAWTDMFQHCPHP